MTTNLTNFIQIYTETTKDMESLFDELYKENFLTLTDLQQKIELYYNIPDKFLNDYDDMIGFEATAIQDGETFKIGLGNYYYDLYQQRNYTVHVELMLEKFSIMLEDNKFDRYIYLYSQKAKERIKVYITEDVIKQWLDMIFEYRIGSITLDW